MSNLHGFGRDKISQCRVLLIWIISGTILSPVHNTEVSPAAILSRLLLKHVNRSAQKIIIYATLDAISLWYPGLRLGYAFRHIARHFSHIVQVYATESQAVRPILRLYRPVVCAQTSCSWHDARIMSMIVVWHHLNLTGVSCYLERGVCTFLVWVLYCRFGRSLNRRTLRIKNS